MRASCGLVRLPIAAASEASDIAAMSEWGDDDVMPTVPIPDWTASGALPPCNASSPTGFDRSPYEIALTDFILRFNTTPERHSLLEGFLRYRQELHKLGLTLGFQWVDGSFLEDVEVVRNRPPHDIDVVTFFRPLANLSQNDLFQLNPALFDPSQAEIAFGVHPFYVQLHAADPGQADQLVELSTYWYSMWSHRRNGEWKGYIKLDLAPGSDQAAQANLTAHQNKPGTP
jgi:hypothetical protein